MSKDKNLCGIYGIQIIPINQLATVISQERGESIKTELIDGVLRVSAKMQSAVFINEETVAEWIKMCMQLELVPEEWRQRWACAERIRELESENARLESRVRFFEAMRGDFDE